MNYVAFDSQRCARTQCLSQRPLLERPLIHDLIDGDFTQSARRSIASNGRIVGRFVARELGWKHACITVELHRDAATRRALFCKTRCSRSCYLLAADARTMTFANSHVLRNIHHNALSPTARASSGQPFSRRQTSSATSRGAQKLSQKSINSARLRRERECYFWSLSIVCQLISLASLSSGSRRDAGSWRILHRGWHSAGDARYRSPSGCLDHLWETWIVKQVAARILRDVSFVSFPFVYIKSKYVIKFTLLHSTIILDSLLFVEVDCPKN